MRVLPLTRATAREGDMADVYELFLTCPKGLESLLLEEAQGLGLDEARAQVSAVRGQIGRAHV